MQDCLSSGKNNYFYAKDTTYHEINIFFQQMIVSINKVKKIFRYYRILLSLFFHIVITSLKYEKFIGML